MDIEYIKRFLAVGQCLNFSKAAEQLFISQPTLSHSIANLEQKLGTPLLERNTKYVKLTPAGERFFTAATEIVNLYDKAVEDLTHRPGQGENALNVGYIGPGMDNTFSSLIRQYCNTYPEVKLQVMRYASMEMQEAFSAHTIDLGVLYRHAAEKIPCLKYQQIGQETFKVCLSADHPLAGQEKIDLSQLKNDPFAICERSTSPGYYDRVLEICNRRGLEPKIAQRVSLVGNIYCLVGAGLCVAIMSYSSARSYDAYNVKFVDIDGEGEDLRNSVVVGWMDQLSPAARKFKELAKQASV